MGPLTGWGQSGRGVAIVTDNHPKRPRRQGESRKDEERRSIIRSLVELDRPVAELEKLLAPLPWDYPTALVTLTYDHIRSVLLRFLAGNLEAKDVEEWADLVEMRDDIEFAEDRTKGGSPYAVHAANPLSYRRPACAASAIANFALTDYRHSTFWVRHRDNMAGPSVEQLSPGDSSFSSSKISPAAGCARRLRRCRARWRRGRARHPEPRSPLRLPRESQCREWRRGHPRTPWRGS